MTENQNQAPALTLEPAMTRDKVMMEEAVKQLEAAPAAAAEATAEMDDLHAQRGRPPGHRGICPEDRPE